MLMLAKAPSSPGISCYLKGCLSVPFNGVVVAVSLDDSKSVDDNNGDMTHTCYLFLKKEHMSFRERLSHLVLKYMKSLLLMMMMRAGFQPVKS